MLVGIHIDPDLGFDVTLERFEKILDHNNIQHQRLDASQPDFWQRVAELDLFIFNWYWTSRQHQLAPTILPIIEKEMKIACFPDMKTWWQYDDKIREYYLLNAYSFPVIPTWIFWDKASAISWLENAVLPVVFKLKSGAGSENVILVETKTHAKKLMDKMFTQGIISGQVPGTMSLRIKDVGYFKSIRCYLGDSLRNLNFKQISPFEQVHKNYIYFQQYLPGNTFDERITIIGGRAFGTKRYIRKNDFRASGSGNNEWNKDNMNLRCIEIAFDISKRLGFQSMSYDFLYDENQQPLISEISYTSPDWSVWSSPGYWDEKLGWHEGHYWPQYCILMDMLKLPNLKQPEMDR
jgi:glutathione synthase/RimK-type ligase-like ATP-grasp enzyme